MKRRIAATGIKTDFTCNKRNCIAMIGFAA
jgi:hypothetical protein